LARARNIAVLPENNLALMKMLWHWHLLNITKPNEDGAWMKCCQLYKAVVRERAHGVQIFSSICKGVCSKIVKRMVKNKWLNAQSITGESESLSFIPDQCVRSSTKKSVFIIRSLKGYWSKNELVVPAREVWPQ
jgi:hypothetical protein